MNRYELATEDYLSHAEMYPNGECPCFACKARLREQDVSELQNKTTTLINELNALELRRIRLELRRAARLERGLG